MHYFYHNYRQYFQLFEENKFQNPFAGFLLTAYSPNPPSSYDETLQFISHHTSAIFEGNILWLEHEVSDYFMIFLNEYFSIHHPLLENPDKNLNLITYMATPNGVAIFSYGTEINKIFPTIISLFKETFNNNINEKEMVTYFNISGININDCEKLKNEKLI